LHDALDLLFRLGFLKEVLLQPLVQLRIKPGPATGAERSIFLEAVFHRFGREDENVSLGGNALQELALQGAQVHAPDDSEAEIWVTIAASATGFTRATAKALVSEAALPDLRPANVEAVQSEDDLNSFTVSYLVVNEGRVETSRSWKEQVWISTKPTLDDDAKLVATFNRTDEIPADEGINSVLRSFACSPDDVGESVYWIVAVDVDDSVVELVETNNVAVSGERTYAPPYAAVVQTDVDKADPSTPIPFYGYAYNVVSGERVGGVDVTIDISNGSFVRTITVTTEADGSFETTWTPLSSEVGSYTIGARRSGNTTSPVQDRFSLMRLSLDTTRGAFNISVGQTVTGSFVVYNKTSEPITNLGARIEGLADNIRLEVRPSSTIVPVGGSATITLAATALNADVKASTATLFVTSAETGDEEIALGFNVYPSYAVLTTDKPVISTTMIVGEQKIVEFEICNESGADSGPITVDLPAAFASWFTCVNGTTLDSLAPGEARKVQLLLNPSADMPLEMYQGRFVLQYGNTGLGIDFHFRAATELFADLTVRATDEWTYYTEDGPALAGATVRVVDALTKQIVSNGTTGADGTWTVAGLAEGYYDIYVAADKHNNYNATIYLDENQTHNAFLQMQTVRYEWTVTPTTIEDEYDITVETIFEANVPAPVVTVTPAVIDISDMEVGERRQIDFTFENHGLIAVYDFMPTFGAGEVFGDYAVTPLVDCLDVLSAKSTCVIPVIFERLDPTISSPDGGSGALLDGSAAVSVANGQKSGIAMNNAVFDDKNVAVSQAVSNAKANGDEERLLKTTGSDGCSFTTFYIGHYVCQDGQWVKTSVTVITVKNCPVQGGPGGDWNPKGIDGGGGASSSSTYVTETSTCQKDDDDKCKQCGPTIGGSLTIKGALLDKALDLVGKIIPAPLSIK
ncbi:MAG: hypothetical protein IKX88_02645, partial [Thermoguttaceae bacterium]|nr:hypothetical protein [Thermoguttaceae bacterium]